MCQRLALSCVHRWKAKIYNSTAVDCGSVCAIHRVLWCNVHHLVGLQLSLLHKATAAVMHMMGAADVVEQHMCAMLSTLCSNDSTSGVKALSVHAAKAVLQSAARLMLAQCLAETCHPFCLWLSAEEAEVRAQRRRLAAGLTTQSLILPATPNAHDRGRRDSSPDARQMSAHSMGPRSSSAEPRPMRSR